MPAPLASSSNLPGSRHPSGDIELQQPIAGHAAAEKARLASKTATDAELLTSKNNQLALAAAGNVRQHQLQTLGEIGEAAWSSPLMLQTEPTLSGALDALNQQTQQVQDDMIRVISRLDHPAPNSYDDTLASFASTMANFEQFCAKRQAVFAPSASSGRTLHCQNDHAGVVIIGVDHGRYRMYESLLVVDTAIPDAHKRLQMHRFVLGDDQQPIQLDELDRSVEEINAANNMRAKGKGVAMAAGADEMETPFRTRRKHLAMQAPLRLRENAKESSDIFVDARLGSKKVGGKKMWADSTHMMPQGVGRRNANGLYDFYMSDDSTENTWHLFQPKDHINVPVDRDGNPKAVQVEGNEIAYFEGIAHIDVMGPKGQEEGVKAAKLSVRQMLRYCRALESQPERQDVTLRLTMEDKSVHQIVFGDNGLWMKLLKPKALLDRAPAAAFGHFQGANDGTPEIFTYCYDGGDNGLAGSESGHAEPQLILPGGTRLPAGPFLKGPVGASVATSGSDFMVAKLGVGQGNAILEILEKATEIIASNAISSAKLIGNLATGNPLFVGGRSGITDATNKLISAAVSGALVMVMNTLLEALPHDQNGARFGGTHGFSAAGGGKKVDPGIIFLAIASMAIVQNALTILYQAISHFIPARITQRETKAEILLNDVALPTLPELARLSASMLVQMGFHFSRGSGGDVGMLAVQSLGNSALDNFARQRMGDPANNVLLENARLSLRFILEAATRGTGNAFSSPKFAPGHLTKDMREGMVTRIITHGPYKLLMPIIGNLSNYLGATGPNAGAHDGQVARSGGALFNLPDMLIGLGNAGLAQADALMLKSVEAIWLTDLVKVCNSFFNDVQRGGNRLFLKPKEPIQRELDNVDAAIRAQKGTPEAAAQHEHAVSSDMQQMITDSTMKKTVPEGSTAIGSNRQQLSNEAAQFMRTLDQGQSSNHTAESQAAATYSPHATKTTQDFRTRPTNSLPSSPFRFHDNSTIPLNASTWSRTAQEFAMPTHNQMLGALGLKEMVLPDGSLMPRMLKLEILEYVVKYTFQSGPFHYGLRWGETGQKYFQKVVEGIKLQLLALNQRGHIEGASPWHRTGGAKFYNPIGALYLNLAMRCSPSFNAIVQRAVGPEAPYVTIDPGDGSPHLKPGDFAMLTENLSSSMSSRLTSAFGQALGFGALPETRNVKLAIHTNATVIVPKTDLGQAESLDPPGKVYRVLHIDPSPPKPILAPGENPDLATQIARVGYLEEIATADLEQNYINFEQGKLSDKDHGLHMLHPESGHLFRYDSKQKNAVYENLFKSYYLGTPMETPTLTTEKARWRHPYTSDFAPATTKDAINAEMANPDSLIRPYLDWAIENTAHAKGREKAAFYQSPYGKAVLKKREVLKANARKIADALPGHPADGVDHFAYGQPGELLAWTTMSMLRRPIDMLRVDADGNVDLDNPISLNVTYDKRRLHDLRATPVGVGADGYYAIRQEDGVTKAFKLEAEGAGHTAGNLLHAINYRAFAEQQQYARGTLADGKLGFVPDSRARNTVRDLTTALKEFAAVDSYSVWHEGFTAKHDALGGNQPAAKSGSGTLPLKGKGKMPNR